MTLREQFKNQLNKSGVDLLLADNNSAYIEWLEQKVNAIQQHTEVVNSSACECAERFNSYFDENPEFSIRDGVIALDAWNAGWKAAEENIKNLLIEKLKTKVSI
jgi:hypothetical protein